MKVHLISGEQRNIQFEFLSVSLMISFEDTIESISFTKSEHEAMAKLQRMANNLDPQEHPSQADLDILDFYNKWNND